MGDYKELNETEIGQFKVGDKVMVNDVKTEIVGVDDTTPLEMLENWFYDEVSNQIHVTNHQDFEAIIEVFRSRGISFDD